MYHYKKETQRNFTYRWFSNQAGLSSPNYLKLVMDGKRNLSGGETIQKFCVGFKLNRQETEFFENLVQYNLAKTFDEKNRFYSKMQRIRPYRKLREIEHDQHVYYANWYCPAIRELATLPGFKEDPEWIATALRPNISVKQASDAMELLLKLGFLRRDDEGKLTSSPGTITTIPEVASIALMNFHKDMLGIAADSLRKTKAKNREISSVTVGISQDEMPVLKNEIIKFRHRILKIFSESTRDPNQVYQMHVSLFPLSERMDELTAIEDKKS
jgi:uncharacterized protein (TIGR02147 family)